MKILALNCAQCAAPIELSAGVATPKCEYCSSTNLVPMPEQKPKPKAALELSDVQRMLFALDEEWEAYRRKWLVRNPNGTYFIPNPEDIRYQKVALYTLSSVASIGILAASVTHGSLAALAVVPLVLVLTAVGARFMNARIHVGEVYERSAKTYRHERKKILGSGSV